MSNDMRTTRRRVLTSLGASTVLIGGSHLGAATHQSGETSQSIISINSPSDVSVEYEFSVSGTLEKSTHVPPGLPHDEATRDDNDHIQNGTVSGTTQGGVDSYVYTGELTAFEASPCAKTNVWIDDTSVNACQLPEAAPGTDTGETETPEDDDQPPVDSMPLQLQEGLVIGPETQRLPSNADHGQTLADVTVTPPDGEGTTFAPSTPIESLHFSTDINDPGALAVSGTPLVRSEPWQAPASGEFVVSATTDITGAVWQSITGPTDGPDTTRTTIATYLVVRDMAASENENVVSGGLVPHYDVRLGGATDDTIDVLQHVYMLAMSGVPDPASGPLLESTGDTLDTTSHSISLSDALGQQTQTLQFTAEADHRYEIRHGVIGVTSGVSRNGFETSVAATADLTDWSVGPVPAGDDTSQ